MTATWALSRATISTLRRQKLFIVPIVGLVLSLLALAGTMLLSNDTSIPARDAEVIAWTAGAAAAFAAGVYGIIVGSSLIAREISDGTLLMVAVRPVARWQIMAGRVLGATIFIVGALLASCAVYGVVAVATAGTTAPFEEPLEAALLSIGGVLLAVAMGAAFSVQGRATAAIGSAIAVGIFATAITPVAQQWRDQRELRSHLTPKVREQMQSRDAIVGPVSLAIVRILPFGVFMSYAADVFDRDVDTYGALDEPREIDVMDRDGFATPVPVAGPAGPPAAAIDAPEPGPAVDPAAAGESATDPTTGLPISSTLPDDPTPEAFQCAEYNGAECFYGFRNAWKERRFDRPSALHEDGGLLLAWLAIPLWVLIGAGLLMRRRDLAAAG